MDRRITFLFSVVFFVFLLSTLSQCDDGNEVEDQNSPTATMTQTPSPTQAITETPIPTPTATTTSTPDCTVILEKTYTEGFALSVFQAFDGGFLLCGGEALHESFLMKVDETGNVLWYRTFYDTDVVGSYLYHPSSHSVAQTQYSGYILSLGNRVVELDYTGQERWTIDANCCKVSLTHDGAYVAAWKNNFGHHDGNGYVSRISSIGEILWETKVSGPLDVKELADGSFISCGTAVHINESHTFDVTSLDPQGNVIFRYFSGYTDADHALSVQGTVDGGYIAVGSLVVKLNYKGKEEWRRILSREYGYGYAVIQTEDKGFLISGNSSHDPYSYTSSNEGYILKTDEHGHELWIIHVPFSYSGLYSIIPTRDNNVVLAGSRNGSIFLMKVALP